MQELNGFQAWKESVCLSVNGTRGWVLEEYQQAGPTVLGSGVLPGDAARSVAGGQESGSLSGSWMRLGLSFSGSKATPSVDGQSLGAFDTKVVSGLVLLGSGFETAGFDNLLVQAA